MPVAVVIDEAVELAKRFSTDNSGRFVNGVLSALAADLRRRRPDPAVLSFDVAHRARSEGRLRGFSRGRSSWSSSSSLRLPPGREARHAAGDDDALGSETTSNSPCRAAVEQQLLPGARGVVVRSTTIHSTSAGVWSWSGSCGATPATPQLAGIHGLGNV